jgi:hypothetical protein
MDIWVTSRREIALQDAANHLGSTIQQMYFILAHETISSDSLTQASNVPPYIEDYAYIGVASLRVVSEPASSKVLEITLSLKIVGNTAKASVLLGQNVEWIPSTFVSDSVNACIRAEKHGEIIYFSFGGA